MAGSPLPVGRWWVGAGLGAVLVTVVSVALVPFRQDLGRGTPALLLVLAVVGAGLVAGVWASIVTAIVAALALNFVFIPPFGTLKVTAGEDWVALAVFLAVALVVGLLVTAEVERRRSTEAREADLARLYEELRASTAQRDALLEDAGRAEVLQRVDEQRAALLRSVSHDLRTPLATIRAVASDLRDGVAYDDATRTELLATVCDEAERLDRIVANLLSMSRIEAGAFEPERQAVDVEELVRERSRRMKDLFRKVRVQVELPADLPLVDGDYSQLDQVFTNLLENAARHAPPGSFVRISGRVREGVVEVRVADEGIGVPDWERTKIFEPFRRGEGSASSGVGLAICKAIVEAHGGRLAVERTAGGGATFVVSLPARPGP
ncbi:MAG TPA: ATP-binding protein [Acidimicrobiales bacterium]|nr:ATP-binding protein [Acidimicrobiales bacterium]